MTEKEKKKQLKAVQRGPGFKKRIVIFAILLALSIVVVVPYVWMLSNSFKTTVETLTDPMHIIPREPTLAGYEKVLTGSPFFKWLRNSCFVTGINTIVILFTSSITGYVFAQFRFRGKDFLFAMLIFTMMVPAQVTMITTFILIDNMGLYNSVWALTEDKWGRIWFSTLGGGLQMLDPKTKKFTTWDTKNSNLLYDYLNSVEWTKKGWLMVGTNHFYSLVNPVSHKLVNLEIPENPNINVSTGNTNYAIEDSRGLIWHGSNVGIIVYDPKTKFQKLIDMTDGLFDSSVNSLIEDKQHNIWAVTDHGVSNIIPQKQDDGTWQFNIRSFNSRDGLQKATYNQRSTWLTRDGKVLIGGQGGLDIINPALLQENKSKE